MPTRQQFLSIIRRYLVHSVFAALIFVPLESFAHAKLVKSDPGRRAIIKTAPKEIRLWFNEKLEPAYSSASLFDGKGTSVAAGSSAVRRDDPKRITLPVGTLLPGEYQVKY